jgi:hypothetical protein
VLAKGKVLLVGLKALSFGKVLLTRVMEARPRRPRTRVV